MKWAILGITCLVIILAINANTVSPTRQSQTWEWRPNDIRDIYFVRQSGNGAWCEDVRSGMVLAERKRNSAGILVIYYPGPNGETWHPDSVEHACEETGRYYRGGMK